MARAMRSTATITIETSVLGLANNWRPPALMPGPHRHNEVELNFIEQGAMTYLFGGTRTSIKAGQVALFWASVPHQVIYTAEQTTFHWLTIPFVTFLQWKLPEVLTRQIVGGRFIISRGEVQEQQRQMDQALFRQWNEDLQQNSDEHRKIVLLETEARLRRLAGSMELHTPPVGNQAETSTILPHGERSKGECMACFIAENYTQALKVEYIAETVHLNPNYATSLFHKCFGISIVDYIGQCRVAHAQSLLVTTRANISAIAFESGFGSLSRFYTAFNKICGQSPAAYRATYHTSYNPPDPLLM